jgi:hypothetical protein
MERDCRELPELLSLFPLMNDSVFDVASDAFATFKARPLRPQCWNCDVRG